MRKRAPRGGDRALSEKMPGGYFDVLSAEIWHIGNLAAGAALDNPFAPSTVHLDSIYTDELVLQLSFRFVKNRITGLGEPIIYTATMSEIEELQCGTDPEDELWTWRQILLDQRRRRRTFSRGTSIMRDGAEIILESQPLRGAKWQKARQLETAFTLDDYTELLDQLQTVHSDLLENS